ncbi:LEVG family PEP-CTERM protein [Rivularia sp. UHCC 0363]|uniref:LEVG family PEP-CTERM protein n=1 Tax=Rivularia sp. UHCC 0363 TaxID=3110244 RepID=UPI002B1EE510|nr:LEVG family PEP-CTERM protein [Rivularia sp. UHCC 0363]MEA5596517.1 LEVG family PEP-CTERM protein [Rivularia sp. UHCC 0363]
MKSFNKLVKTLAISTLGLGIATASISEAKAASLVPQQEGEIQLTNPDSDVSCITGSCIDTTPFGYTVKSLDFNINANHPNAPQFGKSRLFVDDRSTPNDYGFGITFKGNSTKDAGTNPDKNEYWLRPQANILDENGNLVAFENGQLEVGLFEFVLQNTVSEVRLDFFDIEDSEFSGIIQKVNGEDVVDIQNLLLEGGKDSNIQTLVLKDVKSFQVQLGKPGPNSNFRKTGDGVSLQVSVPESENVIGLSALAVAGVLTLKRRKGTSQKA